MRNLLFYDRQTDSLWSQLLSQAVTGPLAGTRLSVLPAENTTWSSWKEEHRLTQVLSFLTPFRRNYNEDPYADYPLSRNPGLFVAAGGAMRIYPLSELKKAPSPLVDQLGGNSVTIVFDRKSKAARVQQDTMSGVVWFVSFLDDLKAFYPDAEIYRAARRRM